MECGREVFNTQDIVQRNSLRVNSAGNWAASRHSRKVAGMCEYLSSKFLQRNKSMLHHVVGKDCTMITYERECSLNACFRLTELFPVSWRWGLDSLVLPLPRWGLSGLACCQLCLVSAVKPLQYPHPILHNLN